MFFYSDVIGSTQEMFNYENIESVEKIIEGHLVYIASAKSLYEMKKNTYREIDSVDIPFLQDHLRNN